MIPSSLLRRQASIMQINLLIVLEATLFKTVPCILDSFLNIYLGITFAAINPTLLITKRARRLVIQSEASFLLWRFFSARPCLLASAGKKKIVDQAHPIPAGMSLRGPRNARTHEPNNQPAS